VDNSIEWFTKLPPGFTHELHQHVAEHSSVDERTGVPVMNFDNFCCGAHGFSALIETQVDGEESHLTLFDTGPDSLSLVRNIGAMQVPIDKVETVVLSHWHSDHSGGLLSFLNLRKDKFPNAPPCTVDLHPDRPIARGIARGPAYDQVIARLAEDPSFELIEAAGAIVEKHSEGHSVRGNSVWVSGEIPRITSYEEGILGSKRWVESEGGSKWISDPLIMDERYAVIDVAGKGLVIFSACSHAGIVNVVKDAVAKFSKPIHMIIGGLHLGGPEFAPRIPPTVDFLSRQLRPSPTYILPMHCSGFHSKIALEASFGEGCVPAGVGMKVEVTGDREFNSSLLAPVISE